MRLVTFAREGRTGVGVLVGDAGLIDLSRALGVPDMVGLLAQGAPGLERVRAEAERTRPADLIPIGEVRLLAPVPRPGKLLCVGYNYLGHAARGAVDLPRHPDVFTKATTAVLGPDEAVVLPAESDQIDYEAELGVVIGLRGRHIAEADALDHVAGYTIVDDVTARDWQNRTSQFLLGKSFDTFAPMGPALVTADEIPDPQALQVELRVNGVPAQRSGTDRMIFGVAFLISYLSQVMTLEPGDVIATGTPAKLPAAEAAGRWLQHGDVVEITITSLGTLRSTVVSSSSATARHEEINHV